MNRLCIYPKDVQVITGKSSRYSRYLINIIKDHYGKQHHQLVTIKEFCEFSGISLKEVKKALNLD